MIAHVLLTLLNDLEKRDKMRDFLKIMSRMHTAFESFKVTKLS